MPDCCKILPPLFLLALFAGPVQAALQGAYGDGTGRCDLPAAEDGDRKQEPATEEEPDCD